MWGTAYEQGEAQGKLLGPVVKGFIDATWMYLEDQVEEVVKHVPAWLARMIANDGLDIELYDCVLAQSLFYCRRPKEPVHLTRENDNDGLLHEFSELESKQITVSTVLHQ